MAIYLPVKFEFDWTKRFRVRVRKQKCLRTDNQTKQTKEQTELHQFQNQLSYDGDLSACQVLIRLDKAFFELESRNKNLDPQTNGQKTDKRRRNYTNFESNLAMMVIYLPVKFEFDWTKCFRVRVRKQKC